VKLHRSFLSMSVNVRAIRFHKANGMTFLTSTALAWSVPEGATGHSLLGDRY
jgi:hypothetical protein